MTIADFLDGLVGDWKKFIRLVALLFFTALAAALAVRLLVWITSRGGLQATQIELSSNPKILFAQTNSGRTEYVTMVQPQSWVNTEIPIRRGDHLVIHAEGAINITSNTLHEQIQRRRAAERRLDERRRRGEFGAVPDSLWLPERHFSANDSIGLTRGWLGPDGDTGPNRMRDTRYPARARNRILPGVAYGTLIGAVRTRPDAPARYDGFSHAFAVGKDYEGDWTAAGGTLWLVVNDVWDDDDPQFPDKFFVDNIGFFTVHIVITHS